MCLILSFQACSCALDSFLKDVHPSWPPLPFRTTSQGILSTGHTALKKSKAEVLLTFLLTSSGTELYHFMTATLEMASNPHKSSPLKQQVQHGISHTWLTHQVYQKNILHRLQDVPDCFLSSILYFQPLSVKLKSFTRTEASNFKIYPSCL